MKNAKKNQTLTKIAQKELGLKTLDATDPRDGVCQNMIEHGVWNIKAALEAAYEAGRRAAKND